MTAHLSAKDITEYLARTLPAAEVLAVHGHLETCADCRKSLEQAAMARIPSAGVPLLYHAVDVHLSEEEMVEFVAGRMPEPRRTEAAQHVAACEDCMDSVSAMESVRNEGAVKPSRPRTPWIVLAGAIAASLFVAALVHYWPTHSAVTPSVTQGPAIVASLRDAGGSIELDSSGALRGLEGASPEEQNLVREVLTQRSLPVAPAISAEAPGVLLAPGAEQPPFSPIGPLNALVLSDRPVFTWQPYPGAEAYQVLVTTEAFDPLARSSRITTTEWQPETPLPRGVKLLWQVRAWRGGEMVSVPAPPAPPARFEIAGPQIAARLEQLRTMPHPSHLLEAILCARAGLRDEAAKEIQILAKENPDSPLVRSLKANPEK